MKKYKKHILWKVKTCYTDNSVSKSKLHKIRYKKPFKECDVHFSRNSELYTDYFSSKKKAIEYLNS